MKHEQRSYSTAGHLATAMLVLLGAGCGGPVEEIVEPEIGVVVVTQWNDSTELFLEYPHLVAGQQTGNWAIHLTDRKGFQPVRSGTLTVVFTNGQGTTQTFTVDAPARDGIFLLDPSIDRPGTYQVRLSLAGSQVTSEHELARVRVFPSLDEAPLAEEEEAGTAIPFLKEQQWVIPFNVEPAVEGAVQRTVSAPGEIVPPDGAMVHVSTPVDGIVSTDANRAAPSIGHRVRRGEVLAVLAPTIQQGGFAQARGQVEDLRREVERATNLLAVGAIPRRRLDEAQHNLDIANAGLEALGGDAAGDYRVRLTAPIDGVVSARSLVPGDVVQAGEILFTIVDPSSAWLRVQVPAALAFRITRDQPATFVVEGSDEVLTASSLLSVGTVLDPETRTVPAVFEVEQTGRRLVFGQLATAAVPVGETVIGIAIPDSAILDENGAPVAYVQTGGEEFERRLLSLGASDGLITVVLSGIAAGEMVVTLGAYQVRLASLSGNEFAGSHAH